jgi:hypothetical protein
MSIDITIAFFKSNAPAGPNNQLIKDVWSAANILVTSFRDKDVGPFASIIILLAVEDDRCGCQSDARSTDRHVDDGMTDAVCPTLDFCFTGHDGR